MTIEPHFRHLGKPCRDKVTKFEGVCESVCFDLYGCVLIMLRPEGLTKDGESKRGEWFDEKRIEAISDTCVIEPPVFFAKPAHKPPSPAVHTAPAYMPPGPAIHGDTNDRRHFVHR